jgi:general secretion pathway protein F
MPDYSFKAYAKDGALVADHVAAADRADAVRQLSARGLVAFELNDGASRRKRTRGSISLKTLAAFSRQMATMIEADLPIDDALQLLARDRNAKAAALASGLRKAVLGGATLSSALSAYPEKVPEVMIGLVAAGEADGFEMQLRTRDALRSALIYPAVLGVTALASLVLVLTVVAPALTPVFAGAGERTPLSARILIGASETLRSYWWIGVLGLLLLILLAMSGFRTPAGRAGLARLAIRTPLVGSIVTTTETSRFLHSLSALLDNGVSVVNALEITRKATGNPLVSREIEAITNRVRLGERLGDMLARSKVFPALAGQLAAVGERSGSLAKMLRHGARVMEEAAQRDVKQLLVVATPALTIILGLLVGGIVLSLLSAILSVNDLAI